MSTEDRADTEGSAGDRPALRVVRGVPTADELAALVAVLAARTGPVAADPDEQPRTWSAHWRGLREPLHAGPDGWRNSTRPR